MDRSGLGCLHPLRVGREHSATQHGHSHLLVLHRVLQRSEARTTELQIANLNGVRPECPRLGGADGERFVVIGVESDDVGLRVPYVEKAVLVVGAVAVPSEVHVRETQDRWLGDLPVHRLDVDDLDRQLVPDPLPLDDRVHLFHDSPLPLHLSKPALTVEAALLLEAENTVLLLLLLLELIPTLEVRLPRHELRELRETADRSREPVRDLIRAVQPERWSHPPVVRIGQGEAWSQLGLLLGLFLLTYRNERGGEVGQQASSTGHDQIPHQVSGEVDERLTRPGDVLHEGKHLLGHCDSGGLSENQAHEPIYCSACRFVERRTHLVVVVRCRAPGAVGLLPREHREVVGGRVLDGILTLGDISASLPPLLPLVVL